MTPSFPTPSFRRQLGSVAKVKLLPSVILGLFILSEARAEEVGSASVTDSNQVWLSSVQWLDDSSVIATQSEGLLLRPAKVVRIRLTNLEDPTTGPKQQWQEIGNSDFSLWSVVSHGDGAIASDYKGRVIKFNHGQSTPFQVESRWIRKIVSVPNQSNQILAGTEDSKLILLSTESNSEVKRVELGSPAIFDIAFNPDASQVAIACGDGTVHIRSWPSLEAVHVLPGQGNAVWSVVYVEHGQQLLTGGADRKVRLWNVVDGSPVVSVTSTPDWVTSLVALPESSLIVAGCLNGDIVLMDYKTMLAVQTYKAASSGIWSMALSPNGKQLALGTRRNGLVLLSDLANWYEAGKAAASAATEVPPEPKDVQ